MKRIFSFVPAAAFAVIPLLASPAHAEDECATDADCPVGFACEEIAWGACPGAPPCEEGEDCPPPPPCEEGSELVCVPAPIACASDSDCPSDLECVTFTYEECWGSSEPGEPTDPVPMPIPDDRDADAGSDAGSDDSPDGGESDDGFEGDDFEDEFECETVTEAYCAPAYVGGCETDSDCGEGFDCVALEVCSCSGSGGSDAPGVPGSAGGGADAGSEDPDFGGDDAGSDFDEDDAGFGDDEREDDEEWEEECSCEPTGEFFCEPREVECSTDADCPDDWTCEAYGDSTETCYATPEGEVICEEDTESSNVCIPPGWDAWAGAAGGDDDFSVPTAEGRGQDGANSDDGEALEEGGDPVPVPSVRGDSSGCTASRGAGSGFGALLVLGALLGRRRRNA